MHDLGVRVELTFLLSGVLLLLGYLFYSALYPRKIMAESGVISRVATPPASYGYLAAIARPLEWTMRRLHRSEWRWAIIISTALVNLLLFPFRVLAARNAKKMRMLQPEIEAINACYKARRRRSRFEVDPEQSQEISELYRQRKTHPMGGCIPAIAPFAVLAVFYSRLTRFPEIQGAPWLWISDLSRPEHLPVRIRPFLMIATQLMVGRITPNSAADPKMNRLTTYLPLVFGLMFYGQPSALLLYWVTSNLLVIAQQWGLGRRYA
jgi:YidC/Oxa1 family membrane protein insertase